MQHPDAIHRVARECALDLAADGVVYAEVRFAPELSTARGLAIEAVVEAMVAGFADGSAGGRRGRDPDPRGVRCCARCARTTGGKRSPGWSCATGTPGWSASTSPGPRSASRPTGCQPRSRCSTGRGRTARSTRARPTASRASGPPWTAPTPSGWATACGSPTRWPRTAALGPLAQRVLDEQVTLEIAPSSNVQTGAYPSLAAHPVDRLHRLGFAVTVNTDNRLMSGVSVEQRDRRRRDDVRLVLGRRADGHRAGAGRAPSSEEEQAAAARRRRPPGVRRPARLTPRAGWRRPPPAAGIAAAIFAANLGVPAHRPVILPDGLSGHERIRADPAFHTWAQLIASRNAGAPPSPFLFHGTRSELYRSPTPHDFGPPCLVRVRTALETPPTFRHHRRGPRRARPARPSTSWACPSRW